MEAGGEAIARRPARGAIRGRQRRRAAGHAHLRAQDEDGNIELTHSISAGLDYAAVGPEHAWLRGIGRARCSRRDDRPRGFSESGAAGILPALEYIARHRPRRAVAHDLGQIEDRARQPLGSQNKDVQTVEKAPWDELAACLR